MATHWNTLRQGDCIEELAKLPKGSVDLVFADPPFNIGYRYDVYDDRRSADEYLAWSKKWMAGVARALKPCGTFWLAIGDEFAAELKVLAQRELGFSCRSWVIWYYTFGVNCVRAFTRSHTHLLHFVKDPEHYTFNADNPAIRVLSARQLVYADGRANPKGRLPDNTWVLRPQDAPRGSFAPKHDTWYFSRVAGTFKEREGFHGCQMPEQLLGRIIRASSNPCDVVLDPFSGSGTTLAVAKKLGRQWFGVELSKDYARRVQKRLDATSVGDPLDGPENPVESSPTTAKGRSSVRVVKGKPLPQADKPTEKGIVAAFFEVAKGRSADYLLCDPEMNAAFTAECKKQGLDGNPFLWNRVLLRIRKSGKLPRTRRADRRLSFKEMDPYSFASEIAMQLVELDYGLKIDDVLCMPEIAAEFDRLAAEFAPGHTPFEYRWAALAIRKRALKARQLGRERFAEWGRKGKSLPKAIPLAKCDAEKYSAPGVYVLSNHTHKLYVGETYDFRSRMAALQQAESWSALDPQSVHFIPNSDQRFQHGLQAALVEKTRPMLNSGLLRDEGAAE